MKTTSLKISDSLYLVHQVLDTKAPAKPVEVATNHITVIDCSGSMSGDLPQIRTQLKKKLPKLLKEKDTLSIIWFSGRKEFGTLIEAEPVSTLADLKDVNNAIDRWLKPVGLTGFKEPIEEVSTLIKRVGKKTPGAVFSLFFISDGCDNVWARPDILKAVENTAGGLASATFVEYGYYADRPLLTQMAEKAGGQLIFAEDFDKYAPAFEAVMQKRPTGAPRVEVQLMSDTVGGFVWVMSTDGDLTTYGVDSGKVNIPEDTTEIVFLSASSVGSKHNETLAELAESEFKDPKQATLEVQNAYAAVSLFSVRMKPNIVLPILKALGDVGFIEEFGGLYGKQKYSMFMDMAKSAALNSSLRFKKGRDPNRIPRDDAFTALELLQLLSSDDQNRVILDDPNFKYSKIGRGRVDSSENLTADELEEIQKLTARIASEKDVKKIKELQKQISDITDKKQPALKFVQDDEEAKKGYTISSLTFNEDKPNVSILIKKSGTVDLSSRLSDNLKGKVPEKFPTSVYRNYAVIKDGLINVKTLPMKLSDATTSKLNEFLKSGQASKSLVNGADAIPTGADVVLLQVDALPVINRNMVKDVSAKEFFRRQWDLQKAQAAQKIYNSFHKELLPQVKTKGFADSYGQEAADWLKEQGFTDYSGFSPKSVQAEAKDMYLAKELKVSLKGFSKLPSLKELKEMIAKNKMNASGQLMLPYLKEVEDFLSSAAYTKAAAKEKVLEAWLDGQMKDARSKTRKLIYEIARTTFTLIVGQVWMFDSIDENTMTIEVDGVKVECKAEMRETEIKI